MKEHIQRTGNTIAKGASHKPNPWNLTASPSLHAYAGGSLPSWHLITFFRGETCTASYQPILPTQNSTMLTLCTGTLRQEPSCSLQTTAQRHPSLSPATTTRKGLQVEPFHSNRFPPNLLSTGFPPHKPRPGTRAIFNLRKSTTGSRSNTQTS